MTALAIRLCVIEDDLILIDSSLEAGESDCIKNTLVGVRSGYREVVKSVGGAQSCLDIGCTIAISKVDQFVIDQQRVCTLGRLDVDGLDLLHRRHVEAGQGSLRQDTGIVVTVAGIVHVQGIGFTGTDDGQQTGDLVNQRRIGTDVNGIGTRTGINRGVAVDGLDVDRIVAVAGADTGGALVGTLNREGIIAATQFDINGLEVIVGDTARNQDAGDYRVTAHAKTGQGRCGKGSLVVRRAVAIVDVQDIHLSTFIDPYVRINRGIEIVDPGLGHTRQTGCLIQRPGTRESDPGTGHHWLVVGTDAAGQCVCQVLNGVLTDHIDSFTTDGERPGVA